MTLFEKNKFIKTVADVKGLAEKLSRISEVSRFNEPGYDEAWELADSFADLEGYMRTFLEIQLPKLMHSDLSEAETFDLLLEIGEELRHTLYHIHDPKSLRYLEPTHEWLSVVGRNRTEKE
jgi:hypothetical protein